MVKVEAVVAEGGALEPVVDQELAEFEQFFVEKLRNTSLTRSELSILKTYLHYAIIDKKKS